MELEQYLPYITALICVSLVAYTLCWPRSTPPPPPSKAPPAPLRDFTLAELRQFDGNDERKGYIALCGQVFDVTKVSFYEKESPYHKFVGHDASVSLARMSFEEGLLDSSAQQLSGEEKSVLVDWHGRFRGKYQLVGRLVK